MSLSPKTVLGIVVLLAAGAGILFYSPNQNYAVIVALLGVGALLLAGYGQSGGASLDGLADAVRRATGGERPAAPPSASPELARVYDELGALADRRAREAADQS